MNKLRNRRVLNLISGILCQVLTAVAGLIIPNLVLNTYGSVLNGLVSTITQMLAYLSLVEMGLSSAALVALYKPMAEKKYDNASAIFSSINKFYQKIAMMFSVGAFFCGIVANLVIKDDISFTTIWLVVLSLAGNNLVIYLLLNKYKVLLQADDKIYIINFVHMFGIILQFCLSYLAIKSRLNIAGVKGTIIVTNIFEFSILLVYCRRKFPEINVKKEPAVGAIKQRKDILVHQILSLVLNNTDVILLTVFSPSLSVVSIYSIYAMIGSLIQNVVNSVISMFSSKMGQLYATEAYTQVNALLDKYEIIYGATLFALYSCMDVLIMPFISIYTKGIADTDYYYPLVGLLFSVYGITRMFRLPYSELTNAAGRFKETKGQAAAEATINLVVSICLLPFLGIVGVLIGSVVGEVYRTIHSYVYCNNRVLKFNWKRSVLLGIANGIVFALIHLFARDIRESILESYVSFLVVAIKVSPFIFITYMVLNYGVSFYYSKIKKV